MFQQFAPGDDDDGKLGYLSKENFVMCLQSLSKYFQVLQINYNN